MHLDSIFRNFLIFRVHIVRKSAEEEFENAKNSIPNFVYYLYQIANSENVKESNAQLSLVLIQRIIRNESEMYTSLGPNIQLQFKNAIISSLSSEFLSKKLKKCICELSGELANIDSWPELFQYAYLLILSTTASHKEMGFILLEKLSSQVQELLNIDSNMASFLEIVNVSVKERS